MAVSFMKKGKAAHAMMDKAEAEAAAKKASLQNQARRFWIPQDKETQITFLDGSLDDEGVLEAVTFWEHQLKISGDWRNWFPCTQVEEPCPICEGGETPYLVALFTIIDHSEYKDNKGVTHKNQKRLFACKRETFRRLQKIAAKRGGLAGITFDVSRGGDKSASVGDSFDFVEKRTLSAIQKAYGLDKETVAPFVYDEVITYRTAKELRKLGFGDTSKPMGSDDADTVADQGGGKTANYEDEV